ncbi:hypothetical protein FRC10_002783 [Ceratobasidium sp. 414]|nr:hypothetical protein FRC10_002783 [Ceratobasidium sp. 414]
MRSSVAGALALFLGALSISALDLPPNHAPPEMLVIPPNVTVMTPRVRNSAFENQIFDFGSAQDGDRAALLGSASVPTILAIVALWVDSVAGTRNVVRLDTGAMGQGAVQLARMGATTRRAMLQGRKLLQGRGVAQSVKPVLVLLLARIPVTRHVQAKISAAVCHPATGYICFRDNAGNAKCRDPNPPPPTTAPEPSSTFIPPPPPPQTTEAETSTYVPPPPPPDPTTIVVSITRTQVVTETHQATQTPLPTPTPQPTWTFQPGSSSPSRAAGSATTSQPVQTDAVLGSQTKKNVGAIAGGVVAGVVAVVILVGALIFWRRRQTSETPATGAQPNYPPAPPNTNQYNPTGAIPPTPNSGDPFLTPMGQHQNLGVSYLNGAPAPGTPPSGSNSGTGPHNASQYSGLPELQQNEMSGFAMPAPMPRYSSSHPRPLPMSVEHSQQPQPQTPNARPWSSYAQPHGVNPAPYVESNNSRTGGWAAPENNGWANPPPQAQAGYAVPPYAGQPNTGPGRPPSTVYQPSSHLAYSPPGSPPMSPPLPDVYGGMAAGGSGGGGLPAGAAPPVNVYGSEEKKPYVPYQ